MQEKLKQLELLVSQALARRKEAEAQNAALRQKIRQLEESSGRLRDAEAELKTLREWKRSAQHTLRRLAARVDKEIQKAKEGEDEIV